MTTEDAAGRTAPRRGRPKGARNVKTIVRAIARERHAVTEGGRTRRLTTVELLIRTLDAIAMGGDVRADKQLERLRDRYAPAVAKGGYLVVPETMSPEEWLRRAEALDRVRSAPPGGPTAAGPTPGRRARRRD